MIKAKQKELISYLESFITTNKRIVFEQVLSHRTREITVVLEDIFQPHNASAVVRSCDCFGIQDLHIIENTNEYIVNPQITVGSAKWMDLYHYNSNENNTAECVSELKRKGYTIVATSPQKNIESIMDYEFKNKTALLFGTELTGLSPIAFEQADYTLRVPMYGFTESFNISVSAALCLQVLRRKLEKSGREFQLNEQEKLDLKLSWLTRSIKRSASYIEDFEIAWNEKNP